MENVIINVLVILCGLAQYGSMVIAGPVQPMVWRIGLFTGMIGSGWTYFGLVKPELNPHPFLTFAIASAIMLVCVLYTYYSKAFSLDGLDAAQLRLLAASRIRVIHQMLIAICIAAGLTIVAAFVEGMNAGNEVQEKQAAKLDDIAANQEKQTEQYKELRDKMQRDSISRAIFQDSVLKNQKQGLQGIDRNSRQIEGKLIPKSKHTIFYRAKPNYYPIVPAKAKQIETNITKEVSPDKVKDKELKPPRKSIWKTWFP